MGKPENEHVMVRFGSDGESIFVAVWEPSPKTLGRHARWNLFDRERDLVAARDLLLQRGVSERNYWRALRWMKDAISECGRDCAERAQAIGLPRCLVCGREVHGFTKNQKSIDDSHAALLLKSFEERSGS